MAEARTRFPPGLRREMGTALIGSVERPQHVTPIDEPKRVGLVRGLKLAGKLAARAATGLPGAVAQSFFGDMGTIPGDKEELAGLRRLEAFTNLANDQRHLPERAMRDVQDMSGGGVMSFVVEHVGDLTHRMSEKFDHLQGSRGTVLDKVEKTLATLENRYGFAKEHRENMVNNARTRGLTILDHSNAVNQAMSLYANAHRSLKVFNEPQKWARDAAVAIGDGDFLLAIKNLRKLKGLIESGEEYEQAVGAFDLNFERPFPRRGKTREEVEQQGGPLSRKVDELLPQILEDHGIEWEYHENGGITADASFRDRSGRMIPDRKYFRPGTTLRTVRDWLGY